jgi:hypothetical protein
VTSVFEFEWFDIIGCRFFTYEVMWWLYLVDMTLIEFGLSNQT